MAVDCVRPANQGAREVKMTQLRKLRYMAAVLLVAVALIVVACNSGPGKSPEMTLSPPEWLHGKWMSPAVSGAVVEVTSDN